MTQLTKHQIIDETVEYYSTHDRAITGTGRCQYKTQDGKLCAHSRCLTDRAREKVIELNLNMGASAHSVLRHCGGDRIHQMKYRGHNTLFWSDVQNLHDTDDYWNGRELTLKGKDYVKRIKAVYNSI